MERSWIRGGLLLTAMMLAVLCLAALAFPQPQTQSVAESSLQPEGLREPVQLPAPEPDHLYEMGIWQGNVAVFTPGEEQPFRVLEMPAAMLPIPDQAALEQRIAVKDDTELAGFLEDYGS